MGISTTILLFLTFGWGMNNYRELQYYNVYVENQLQRMFYDLIADVENIQSSLSKVLVSGSPKQNVMILADLMYKSYDAQEKLTQLPINHSDISKTQKFLSQVGDLCYALVRKNLEGTPLSLEDISNLEELHNYSNYLSESLLKLHDDMKGNGNRIRDIIKKGKGGLDKVNEHILNTSFMNVEERMQEYPELIYDGPFSEHMSDVKPKLKGKEISKDEAIRVAEGFFKDGKKYVGSLISETENTKIPAYIIDLKRDGMAEEESIVIGITKTGGFPLWMFNTTPTGVSKIQREKALQLAGEFLEKNGFKNMEATYYEEYDGQLVINFAYKEDDIIVYTDLIKVKISLEDGDIKGFEAEGYLTNHHERRIEDPLITEDEARQQISPAAEIEKARLSIIPTQWGTEVLCYEFQIKYKSDTFLVYINAKTGEEERILQMITTNDGVFTM